MMKCYFLFSLNYVIFESMISRPPVETIPSNYQDYISQVTLPDLMEALKETEHETISVISLLGKAKENFAYSPGKWTVKDVIQHLIDAERIFSYRILRCSRKDNTAMESFDENHYALHSDCKKKTLDEVIDEFVTVRQGSLQLLQYLPEDMLDFKGFFNQTKVSARIIGWVMAGHNMHHCKILNSRYLIS